MSLEHKVSGDKTYFIPQNISSFSGSSAYDPRVDIFKFGVFEEGVNLTGGTRYWVKQRPPALVYLEAPFYYSGNLQGTDKLYYDQTFIIPNLLGSLRIYYDTANDGEIFTGGTFFADSIDLTAPLNFGTSTGGNLDYGIPYAQVPLATTNGGWTATTFTYTLQTNSGRTFSDTLYLASMEEIGNIKPWEYYGDEYQDNFRRPNYPITYLGETSINLKDYGWYYYRIYEQTSQTNLNPLLATDIVDEGVLYLYPPPPDEVSYTGYSTGDITIYDEDKVPTYHILQENEYHLLTENNYLLTQE